MNENSSLRFWPGRSPLLGSTCLYQADWLLRYYHFEVDELLSEDRPDFNIYLDPKCDWALRHLEFFPVEINKASYQTLLRVPGIGYKSAERIVKARTRQPTGFCGFKADWRCVKKSVVLYHLFRAYDVSHEDG